MQTQQNPRTTHSLEELLTACQSMRTADKPLVRFQSELALAAVLHASKVVGSRSPQSTLGPLRPADARSSSLPVGIPTYSSLQAPQPAVGGETVPGYMSQVCDDTLPLLPRMAGLQADRPAIKSCLYKTEMCRGWEATGRCRYGSKCQFAHGGNELQPVMRHPKYKTEICRIFAQTGACRYGKRCRFIHPEMSTDGFFLQHMSPQTDITYATYQSRSHDINLSEYHSPEAMYPYTDGYPSPQALYHTPNSYTPAQAGIQCNTPSVYSDQTMHSANDTHSSPQPSPYASPRGSSEGSSAYSGLSNLSGMHSSAAAGTAEGGDVGLLGSAYNMGSDCVCLPGEHRQACQVNTSPRGVLDYAAAQGCGYHPAGYTANEGLPPKSVGPMLLGDFRIHA